MTRPIIGLVIWAAATVLASPAAAESDPDVLGVVRITRPVLADGKPLPEGTYELRLTGERPVPRPGQSVDGQQVVEFVVGGMVAAREVAEVLRDDELPPIGDSSRPVRTGVRVEILKGGEFLRVSIKRERERYLVHLPIPSP